MEFTFEVINNLRQKFKNIIEETSLENLNKIPQGFNNNIIWNIGHVVVSEQLLAYKLCNMESSLSDEMINKYRKGTKPLNALSQVEVDQIKELLLVTSNQTKNDYSNNKFKNYNPYTVSTTGNSLNNIEDALQFIAIHEGLHYGYVLALLKAIKS